MYIKQIIFITIGLLILACQAKSEDHPRERVSIDFDWRFIQKDIDDAERISFDDSDWRQLKVPSSDN